MGRLRDFFRPRQELVDRCLARIDALEREVANLRVEQHEVVMEWGSTLDKLRTAWARQRKRDQRALHREVEQETVEDGDGSGTPPNGERPPDWQHNKVYLRSLHAQLANPRRSQ